MSGGGEPAAEGQRHPIPWGAHRRPSLLVHPVRGAARQPRTGEVVRRWRAVQRCQPVSPGMATLTGFAGGATGTRVGAGVGVALGWLATGV